MSLTQTEQGYPPAIEHIGVPQLIQDEKGIDVRPGSAASSCNHPWNMGRSWKQSGYLQERKKQLQSYMTELDPHKPVGTVNNLGSL